MAKMSYQEANYIKGASLGNLIEQNLRSGKGLIGATRGAISQRMSAKATGIREKLDPLNLFRFLSGGNPLAFRLLGGRAFGRLTGRNDRDVDYFAGGPGSKRRKKKAEPFVVHKVSRRITPIQRDDTMADGLSKLYALIKSSFEEKIRKSELQKDFEGAKQAKAQKRHDELLKAIYSINGRKPTASRESDDEDDMSLLDKVNELFSYLDSLKKMAAFLATPEVLILGAIAASVSVGAIGGIFFRDKFEKSQEVKAQAEGGEKAVTALKQTQAANQSSTGLPSIGDEGYDKAKNEYDTAVKQKQEIVGQIMAKKGYKRFEQTILGKPQGKYTFEDAQGNPPSAELLKQANDEADAQLSKSKSVSTPVTPITPTASPVESPAPSVKSNNTTPTATPAPSVSPTGAKAVEATNENMVAQNESLSSGEQIVVNNQTKNTSAGGKAQSSAIGETAVRNDDDSLMKVQKQSLRGV
jgi:hypothetical protein